MKSKQVLGLPLENSGQLNLCYVNSVINSLFSANVFASKIFEKRFVGKRVFRLLKDLRIKKTKSARMLRTEIGKENPEFANCSQQDAAEFFEKA